MAVLTADEIFIPPEATACAVAKRHSASVQEGDEENRTLTDEGVELCDAVREDYRLLDARLAPQFGVALHFSSNLNRSLITQFAVTRARQIRRDARVNTQRLTLRVLDEGRWVKSRIEQGYTEPQLIREALGSAQVMEALRAKAPVYEVMADFTDLVLRRNGFSDECRYVDVVGHEIGLSLVALEAGIEVNELGLEPLQSFVYFLLRGEVISVQKFTPMATLLK